MARRVERVDPVTVRVSVQVPWGEVERKYAGDLRKLGGTLRVRGFRPGKAPLSIVENLAGGEVLRETAVGLVAAEVEEAIKEGKLHPVRREQEAGEGLKPEKGKDLAWEQEIEVLPEIGELDLSGVELDEAPAVSPETVDEQILALARRGAPLAEVPDGEAAREHDVVVVSGEAAFDDAEIPALALKDERVDTGPGGIQDPALKAACVGKKAGDRLEVKAGVVPKREGERVAEPATVKAEVVSVLRRKVPPLDDDLAKDFGMKSIEEMRAEIRGDHEKRMAREWTDRNGGKILRDLAEKIPFPLPSSYRKVAEKQVAQLAGGKSDEEKAKTGRDAERDMRVLVLSQVIALANGLKISEEELARSFNAMHDILKRVYPDGEERKEIMRRWLMDYETTEVLRAVNAFLVGKVRKAAAGGEAAGEGGGTAAAAVEKAEKKEVSDAATQ